MTSEQQEKIIELQKCSIATAMDLNRDRVRNFCKSRGLDVYGTDYKKSKLEQVNTVFNYRYLI